MDDNTSTFIYEHLNVEEDDFIHRPAGEEIMFYRAVAEGSLDVVQENCNNKSFADAAGVGILSDNPVNNMKYHFVVSTALITRFCIEAGMEFEEGFRLSDRYIQKMDKLTNMTQILFLHNQMAMDFTARMRIQKKSTASNRQVASAIDYIYNHILEPISVEQLAEAIGISPTYLSRIFKKDLGISVSEYIRQRKIDVAKNLLRFTDYDFVTISNMLSFSSQSHFIQQFKSHVGVTPKVYRDENYMRILGKSIFDDTPGPYLSGLYQDFDQLGENNAPSAEQSAEKEPTE